MHNFKLTRAHLRPQTLHSLYAENIFTRATLEQLSDTQLLHIPGIGKKALREIAEFRISHPYDKGDTLYEIAASLDVAAGHEIVVEVVLTALRIAKLEGPLASPEECMEAALNEWLK